MLGLRSSCLLVCLSLTVIILDFNDAAKITKDGKFPKKQIPEMKEFKKSENFVKKLEYRASNAGQDNSLTDEVVVIDLNLLPDKRIADDVEESLDEEFEAIDKLLGDEQDPVTNKSSKFRNNRQMSLMYQGVYAPDSRFNAFVDGVMVNMVVEMRRKKMDPLYFRVYDRGVIEHVPTQTSRQGRSVPETTTLPSSDTSVRTARQKSRGKAIGGGVVRGLTRVKRFGNAEVQVAGNTTLVRSHLIFGPVNVELVFDTPKGVKTINSTLSALAGHALSEVISSNTSKHKEFLIDSPLEYQIDLVGTKDSRYRSLSSSAIMRLYKPEGRMERRLRQCMNKAQEKPVSDITKIKQPSKRQERRLNRQNRRQGRQRNGNRKKNQRNMDDKEDAEGVPLDMESVLTSPESVGDSIGASLGIRN